jgi:hypothetical protein
MFPLLVSLMVTLTKAIGCLVSESTIVPLRLFVWAVEKNGRITIHMISVILADAY